MQDLKKSTLKCYKYWLENKGNEYGVNFSFRSNEHEISLVTQPKIALIHLIITVVLLVNILV